MDLSGELQLLKYLSDPVETMTGLLGLTCEPFHREWVDLIEHNNFVALLAPRGHGKTTIVGGYIIWKVLQNPDVRVLIVTINQDKANEMMTFVQRHLEANEKITSIFGNQRSYSEWSKSSCRVASCKRKTKEPTLSVLGVTSSMVGGHYDLIILDDIADEKNSRTDYRRKNLVRWFNSTLMPMLEPKGKVISIGTKWHQDDIHSYFQNLPGYETRIYKAIIEEPDDDGKGGVALWPDRFSFEKLDSLRRTYGNVSFMMQYQNEYISDEESPIKYDWVQSATNGYKTPEKPYRVYMGVDLASKGEESDYFTISIIAVRDGVAHLIDGFRAHISMHRQFQVMKSYIEKHNPIKIGIESAAQQKMITDQFIEENPTLPIVEIKSSIVNDRMSRVMRLSVLFETGRIFINPRLVEWSDELISFPRGSHDDTIDSLSFAIQVSQEMDEGKIDWEIIPDLITARKRPSRSNVFNVIKI